MKKILISALFATSCLSAPALAQTTTTTTGETTPPATTTGTTTAPAGAAASNNDMQATDGTAGMQNEGGFYTYQEGNQVLGSGLMGASIRGADGENIGSVDDLLLDRNGQVLAVVVGVGGFLGIGDKNVAIANDQLQFVLAQEVAANNQATGGAAGTNESAASGGTAPMTGNTAAPATGATTAPADANNSSAAGTAASGTAATAGGDTANTAGGAGAAGSGMAGTANGPANAGFGWTGAGIDHIQVNFTRQQLEDAPAFEAAE